MDSFGQLKQYRGYAFSMTLTFTCSASKAFDDAKLGLIEVSKIWDVEAHLAVIYGVA